MRLWCTMKEVLPCTMLRGVEVWRCRWRGVLEARCFVMWGLLDLPQQGASAGPNDVVISMMRRLVKMSGRVGRVRPSAIKYLRFIYRLVQRDHWGG